MRCIALALLLLPSIGFTAEVVPAKSNPRVRAITAFVRLDCSNFFQQIEDTLVVLHRAESEFKARGYEVQTVRITTQPLAELVSGLSEEQALSFLKELDDVSAKQNFNANIGPAALHDSDDPSTMHLLERVLTTLPHLNASATSLTKVASIGTQFAVPLSWLSTSQNTARARGTSISR